MRLLRLQDVEIGPHDCLFRHSRLRALIVWLAGFAAATALFLQHRKVAARVPLRLVSADLSAFDAKDGDGALPSFQLAGPDERDGNLCAISFLSELPVARR